MTTLDGTAMMWTKTIETLLEGVAEGISASEQVLATLAPGPIAAGLRELIDTNIQYLAELHGLRLVAGRRDAGRRSDEIRERVLVIARNMERTERSLRQWHQRFRTLEVREMAQRVLPRLRASERGGTPTRH